MAVQKLAEPGSKGLYVYIHIWLMCTHRMWCCTNKSHSLPASKSAAQADDMPGMGLVTAVRADAAQRTAARAEQLAASAALHAQNVGGRLAAPLPPRRQTARPLHIQAAAQHHDAVQVLTDLCLCTAEPPHRRAVACCAALAMLRRSCLRASLPGSVPCSALWATDQGGAAAPNCGLAPADARGNCPCRQRCNRSGCTLA